METASSEWALALAWGALLIAIVSAVVLGVVDGLGEEVAFKALKKAERELRSDTALRLSDVHADRGTALTYRRWVRSQWSLLALSHVSFAIGLFALAVFAWSNL